MYARAFVRASISFFLYSCVLFISYNDDKSNYHLSDILSKHTFSACLDIYILLEINFDTVYAGSAVPQW